MKTVLIVEDGAVCRELLESVLRQQGYGVRTAPDGVQGLAAMAEVVPDLVILDLEMPVMDGLAMLGRMRRSARLHGVPVIALTSRGDRGHIAAAAKLGIRGYVLKSAFDLGTMLERLKEAMGPAAPAGEVAAPAAATGAPAESASASPAPETAASALPPNTGARFDAGAGIVPKW